MMVREGFRAIATHLVGLEERPAMSVGCHERRSSSWRGAIGPALASTIFHASAIALLALTFVAIERAETTGALVANLSREVFEPGLLEPTHTEVTKFEKLDEARAASAQGLFAMSEVVAPVEVELVDFAAATTGGWGDGLDLAGIGDLGRSYSSGKSRGDYLAGGTSFYGISTKGKSLAYVVDCSRSMLDNNRFLRARDELIRSIQSLDENSKFYVLFYNHETFFMDASGLVEATDEEIARAEAWIRKRVPSGFTVPLPALLHALSLRPDAIYFLSDGKFDVNTVERVQEENISPRVPIHSIALDNREGEFLMRAIAKQSGGTFRFASSKPAKR